MWKSGYVRQAYIYICTYTHMSAVHMYRENIFPGET